MSNSHLSPSMMAETQSIVGDLLAPVILASTLTTPGSGMTLPAFSTTGYVRQGSPTRLVFVNQPAVAVPMTGGDGTYWVALMHDTYSAVSGWSRVAGSHYAWQAAATQPASPAGGLVLARVIVAGGAITSADIGPNYPANRVAYGAGTGGLAFDPNLTWTGGVLKVIGQVDALAHIVLERTGDGVIGFYTTLNLAGGTGRFAINTSGTAPVHFGGTLNVVGAATLQGSLQVTQPSGFSGVPVAGYSLTTYANSQFAANVSVGMLGSVATAALDVNGAVRSRGTLTCDVGGYVAGTFQAGGAVTCNSTLGVGSHLTVGGNLTVTGTTNLTGHTIMSTAGTTGGFTCGGTFGTQYIQTGLEVGIMRAPVAGFALSVGGAIQSNNAIANKLGAGPWGESSSRHLKRNITAIPDALSLLLEQRGRRYEWNEPERASVMPGHQHGFVFDEVSIPQWKDTLPDGTELLTLRGSEALFLEALRQVVTRLETLERAL